MSRGLGALLLATMCVAVSAQPVHLSPPYESPVERGTTLLSFATSDDDYVGTRVSVQDGFLVVTQPGRAPQLMPLENRRLVDLINTVQQNFEGLKVTSSVALHDASELAASNTELRLVKDEPSRLTARGADPSVSLGFGLLLNIGQTQGETREGVLNQTGFLLDVAGVHQLLSYSEGSRRPSVYVSGRIHLASDQNVLVPDEEGTGQGASGDFESALRQADQLSMQAQTDIVTQLGGPAQELGFYAGLDVGYTQAEAVAPPRVFRVSEDSTIVVADEFTADAIARATRQTTQPVPLYSLGGGLMLRFIRDDRPAFYFGGGVEWKDLAVPTFRFRPLGEGEVDPESLSGRIATRSALFGRVVIGVRIPGIVDVRADALSPFRATEAEPLLRVAVARSFPLGD